MALKFIAAMASLVLSAGAALAQGTQKVQLADCTGSGCTCSVTNLTLTEVAAALPIEIPDGAEDMMLVRAPNGTMGWSTMAPADLDMLYGGQGNCPLQLFEDIVPRDGSWHITDVVTDTSQCPMVALAGMGGLESATTSVNWGGRFHPERLFPETRGMVRWSQTGHLSWRGVVVDEQAEGAFARVTFTARLISPTLIRGESRFAFNMHGIGGMNAATLAAGGGCLTVTSYVARWRG